MTAILFMVAEIALFLGIVVAVEEADRREFTRFSRRREGIWRIDS